MSLCLQPHPVHARPDADGHHRHRILQELPGGKRAFEFAARARSSPTSCWPTKSTARRPRRRPRCSRRCRSTRSPSAATRYTLRAAVLRAGHAESDRAGRHLSAARGAARSLHVHDRLDYPNRDEEIAIARTTTGAALPQLDHILTARRCTVTRTSSAACRCRITSMPTPPISCGARRTQRWRGARMAQAAGRLGRRTARRAEPHPRRQGPRRAARQLHGAPGGRHRGRRARPAPPRHHHLHRGVAGHHSKDIVERLIKEMREE